MLWGRGMLCTLEIRGVQGGQCSLVNGKAVLPQQTILKVVAWQRMDARFLELLLRRKMCKRLWLFKCS